MFKMYEHMLETAWAGVDENGHVYTKRYAEDGTIIKHPMQIEKKNVLKNHPDNITLTIEPMMAYKYAGDIVGVFQENNVPAHLHWIAMRMNGLINPSDYTEDMTVLIVPSSATVDKLRNTFNSQSKLKK